MQYCIGKFQRSQMGNENCFCFFLYFKTLEWFKKVHAKNSKKENNRTECIVMLTQPTMVAKKTSNTITISISTTTMDETMPMHSVNRLKTIVVYDVRWSRQCNFQQWKNNGAASLDEKKRPLKCEIPANVRYTMQRKQAAQLHCEKKWWEIESEENGENREFFLTFHRGV